MALHRIPLHAKQRVSDPADASRRLDHWLDMAALNPRAFRAEISRVAHLSAIAYGSDSADERAPRKPNPKLLPTLKRIERGRAVTAAPTLDPVTHRLLQVMSRRERKLWQRAGSPKDAKKAMALFPPEWLAWKGFAA